MQPDINLFSVFIAAVAAMAVGAIWYAPGVLGKKWMQLAKVKPNDINKKAANRAMAMNFLALLVMAYVLAIIVSFYEATTFSAGVLVGCIVWLGFIVTYGLSEYVYYNRPLNLFVFNMSYHLISVALMGGILAAWS